MAKNVPVDWEIKNLDTGQKLLPPYPLAEEGLRVTIAGAVTEQPRFGFQDPITQWTSGRARVLTFTSVLYAVDSTERIATKFKQFEKLAIKDPTLGRPPICVFTLGSGSILSETVLVESIDVDVPPIRPDGEPRQITLGFTLRRYRPFSQTQVDPTKPTKESYFLVVTSAEQSYEAIARRYYGDPLKGDRLRKRHPGMPLRPEVGSKISVPAKAIILREEVAPAFHALSLTDEEAVGRFEEILDERSGRKVVL